MRREQRAELQPEAQVTFDVLTEELRATRSKTEPQDDHNALMFDLAPIGYAILEPNGTIQSINQLGAALLGKAPPQLVGAPFQTFLAFRDRPAFADLLARSLEREALETCEVALTKRGEIPLAAQLTARALSKERIVLLAFEDITERRHRERVQRRTEHALREQDHRKDEVLAALSHELRNPLAPIRNSVFLLSRVDAQDDRAVKARAIIDRQVHILSRLIEDLLDTTRIARGKVRLQVEALDLESLVRQTVDDHRLSFEAAAVNLTTRFDPGATWVEADAVRLAQALGSVLSNAGKLAPPGGTVVVELRRGDDETVAIRVGDPGAGIERGDPGLGLAMAKGLIELHGGTVRVASDDERRATSITIQLPVVGAPADDDAPAPEAPARRHRRVLVIDDNSDSRDALQYALETSGHDVRVAHDGVTGIQIAQQFRPEVVVSDIGMPGMDGYAIARAFRADQGLRKAYLLAVSGHTRPEDIDRACESGFDQHLCKPVMLEDLERLICEVPVRKGRRLEGRTGARLKLHSPHY